MPQAEALARCDSCGQPLLDAPPSCPECGEPTAPPERRLVTVLFADITGYTELCEQLDPEDVFRFVRPTMTALRQVVESFGGSVPQVQGDGFLALFGAPHAHEDDAQRAVRTAVALGDRVAELNAGPVDVAVPPLHIGVNTGLVLVAASREESGISVTGAPVNEGARLCALANPGEVLVGARTIDLCRGVAEFGDPRDLPAKGVTGSLRAYPLVSIRPDVLPGRRVSGGETRFVGRAEVLGLLDAALAEVIRDRSLGALAVLAEPGAGKTRLATEWAGLHPELTCLTGGCSPYGGLLPLAPLAEALGIASEAGPVQPGDDPALVVALRKRVEAAAGPVALVVDDVQWASTELLDAIDWLARDPWPLPVLVIALARTDAAVPGSLRAISMGGLTVDDLRVILDDIVGGAVPDVAAQQLVARAGGSPLFLEESARLLLESGDIAITPGGVIVDQGAIRAVPNSMRMFITARLDALPDDELSVLRDAAVAGDATWSGLVEAMGSTPGALHRCIDRGLLRPVEGSSLPGQAQYAFKHALIRDVAYEALPRRERAVRHRRVADWLVQAHDGGAAKPVGTLAYHYHQAWLLARAGASGEGPCDLAVLAVEHLHSWGRALQMHQARGAEVAYAQALDVVENAPGCIDLATQARLHVDRAQTLNELGRFIESLDDQRLARQLAEVHGLEHVFAEALTSQVLSLSDMGRVEEAREVGEEARRRFRALGDRRAEADVLRELAYTHRFEDVHVMADMLRRAHAAYVDVDDAAGQATAARELAYIQTMEGGADFARWRDVAATLTDSADVRGQAAAQRSQAFIAEHRGDWAAALVLALQAAGEAVAAGNRWVEVDAALVRLSALLGLGRLAEAENALAEAMQLAERIGGRRTRAVALTAGAKVAVRMRAPLLAEERLEQARRLLGELGAVGEGLAADLAEAAMRVDRGLSTGVEQLVEPAIEWFEQRGWGFYVVPARVLIGRNELLHDPLDAQLALAGAVDAARRHDQPRFGALAAACLVEAQLLAGLPPNGLLTPGESELTETRAVAAECDGLRAWRREDGAAAARAFGDAAAVWDTLGATVWLARALLWQGAATRRVGAQFDDAPAHALLADLRAPDGIVEALVAALVR